ncbi:MAG: TraR/DksA C4-type zinc finger protein, partial [Leptospirales bacterium]|nr:TraR/DksA C4-type zinc finger protein [Leptospirales bacterium]
TTREMIEQNPRGDDYLMVSDEELFDVREVTVEIPEGELPGKPARIITCASCGERVMDMRDVSIDGKYHCIPCTSKEQRYYSEKS